VHFFIIENYIFEIYKKFCVFWYPWSPYCEKKIWPLYTVPVVKNPKSCDQWWSSHWVKINFFAIFGTFEVYVTNLRGTFVEIVKKSQKSTHPNIHLRPVLKQFWENNYLKWAAKIASLLQKKFQLGF
jgi:hypothetical protein